MDISINTIINPDIKEIKINIESPVFDEQVANLVKLINNPKEELIAKRDGKVYILKLDSISEFYTFRKNVFLKCNNTEYETSYRLYELEEMLPPGKFIRISHSCIVNKDRISFFDTTIVGEILVKMKDGGENYVSKRRINKLNKELNKSKN